MHPPFFYYFTNSSPAKFRYGLFFIISRIRSSPYQEYYHLPYIRHLLIFFIILTTLSSVSNFGTSSYTRFCRRTRIIIEYKSNFFYRHYFFLPNDTHFTTLSVNFSTRLIIGLLSHSTPSSTSPPMNIGSILPSNSGSAILHATSPNVPP